MEEVRFNHSIKKMLDLGVEINLFFLAVGSRAMAIIFALFGNRLIVDHVPGGAEIFQDQKDVWCQTFLRWDSVYYITLAQSSYKEERYYVFFPLYPTAVKQVHDIFQLGYIFQNRTKGLMIAALVLNLCCSVLSLHQILIYLRKWNFVTCRKDLNICALVFLFCPASVFFITVYTESLFSSLSWTGLALVGNRNPFIALYRIRKINILGFVNDLAVGLLAYVALITASCTRMNGSLNSVQILLAYLLEPINYQHEHLDVTMEVLRLMHCLVSCLCAVAPAIWWERYMFLSICGNINSMGSESISSSGTDTLKWCTQSLQSTNPLRHFGLYAHLQKKYWNVGFLSQWHWKQIPNFFLAAPIVMIALHAIRITHLTTADANELSSKKGEPRNTIACILLRSFLIPLIVNLNSWRHRLWRGDSSGQGRLAEEWEKENDSLANEIERKVDVEFLPWIAHLVALLMIGVFWAHVQVTTRLVCSSSPLVYAGLADLMLGRRGPRWQRLCQFYLISFNVIGILLHTNFFPWT